MVDVKNRKEDAKKKAKEAADRAKRQTQTDSLGIPLVTPKDPDGYDPDAESERLEKEELERSRKEEEEKMKKGNLKEKKQKSIGIMAWYWPVIIAALVIAFMYYVGVF